ncbi:hypothetical protein Bbelb_048250 [Branchiostoma belcheri]|nr:hypothetical protein Bbelb_048250 [Branchiostoma belcheri]
MVAEWRQRDTPQGMYTDVYDGQVWSAFQVVDGKPSLADRGNLAFMLNVDWFQPYKCTRLKTTYTLQRHHKQLLKQLQKKAPKLETVRHLSDLEFPGHRAFVAGYLTENCGGSIRHQLPMNFRVAPSSIMAENEVRQFITNEKMTISRNTHQQNKISEAAKIIRMDRTTIPIDLLKKYPRDAQTHCERIADFLLPGHAVHWHKEEGQIVFHDSPNDQPNPLSGLKLHHFHTNKHDLNKILTNVCGPTFTSGSLSKLLSFYMIEHGFGIPFLSLLANIRFPNQPSCYQHEDMVTGYLINSTCPGTQKEMRGANCNYTSEEIMWEMVLVLSDGPRGEVFSTLQSPYNAILTTRKNCTTIFINNMEQDVVMDSSLTDIEASDVETRSNPAEELAPAPQIVVDQLKEIMNNAKTVLDTTIGRIGERFDSFVSHPVVNAARVFDMSNWPDYDDDDDTEDFGAVQIGAIYHHYKQVLDAKGFSFQDALMEWTELQILVNRRYPRRNKAFSALWPSVIRTQQESARFANIFMIIGLLLAFPVNSAECERAFSLMNTVKTDWRNKLTSISLTSLMKITPSLLRRPVGRRRRRELCRRGTILPRKEFATERFFASNRAERVARDIWGFPRLKDGQARAIKAVAEGKDCFEKVSRSHPGCQRGSAAGPTQAVNEGQAAGPTQAVNEGQAAGPTQAVNEGQAAGPTQAVNEGQAAGPTQAVNEGQAAGPTQAVNEGQAAGPTQAVNEGQAAGPTQAVNEGLQQVPPRLSTRVRQQVPPRLSTRVRQQVPPRLSTRAVNEGQAAGPTQAVNEGQAAGPTQAVNEGQEAGPTQAVNEGLQQVPPRLSTRVRQQVPPRLSTRVRQQVPPRLSTRVCSRSHPGCQRGSAAGPTQAVNEGQAAGPTQAVNEGLQQVPPRLSTMKQMKRSCTCHGGKSVQKSYGFSMAPKRHQASGGRKGGGELESTEELAIEVGDTVAIAYEPADGWYIGEIRALRAQGKSAEIKLKQQLYLPRNSNIDGVSFQPTRLVSNSKLQSVIKEIDIGHIHHVPGHVEATHPLAPLVHMIVDLWLRLEHLPVERLDLHKETHVEENTVAGCETHFDGLFGQRWTAVTIGHKPHGLTDWKMDLIHTDNGSLHLTVIREYLINCTACNETHVRMDMAQHMDICGEVLIECRGCGNTAKRSGLEDHVDNKYNRLSSRVAVIFQQYRYQLTNMQRRHSIYLGLSGPLSYYPRKAQTHSERVSDFLLLGYGIHWQVEGEDVVFHDSPTQDPVSYPARPALHHYRSTSIKHEHAYLDKAWRKCLEEALRRGESLGGPCHPETDGHGGKNNGYTRLSPRVKIIFQQYRYEVSNFHRRNRVYRAISGLLTYGLRRRPPGTYYNYNEDLLDVVRDTYPSGDDVNWMLTNQDNKGGGRGGLTTEGLVEMFYRKSHQHKWKYNKNGMFRTDQQGKLVRPTGRPKLLLPVFEKREVNVGNLLDQKLPKYFECVNIASSSITSAQENEYEVLRDDVIRNTAAPTIEQHPADVNNETGKKGLALTPKQWAKLKALPLLGAIRDATCHDMPYYCMGSPPSPYTSTTQTIWSPRYRPYLESKMKAVYKVLEAMENGKMPTDKDVIHDEQRSKKSYGIPVRILPCRVVKDAQLRTLKDDLQRAMEEIGMVVVGFVIDGEWKSLRTIGSHRAVSTKATTSSTSSDSGHEECTNKSLERARHAKRSAAPRALPPEEGPVSGGGIQRGAVYVGNVDSTQTDTALFSFLDYRSGGIYVTLREPKEEYVQQNCVFGSGVPFTGRDTFKHGRWRFTEIRLADITKKDGGENILLIETVTMTNIIVNGNFTTGTANKKKLRTNNVAGDVDKCIGKLDENRVQAIIRKAADMATEAAGAKKTAPNGEFGARPDSNAGAVITIDGIVIKGYHVFQRRPLPGLEMDITITPTTEMRVVNTSMPAGGPALSSIPPDRRDVVIDAKRGTTVRSIAGKAIGRLPAGSVQSPQGVVATGPPRQSYPPWPAPSNRGGGAVIPCSIYIKLDARKKDGMVAKLKEAVDRHMAAAGPSSPFPCTLRRLPNSLLPTGLVLILNNEPITNITDPNPFMKDYEIVSPECGELRILRYNSGRHDSTSMIFGRQITAVEAEVKYKFRLRGESMRTGGPTVLEEIHDVSGWMDSYLCEYHNHVEPRAFLFKLGTDGRSVAQFYTEYAAPVWRSGLTASQSSRIERIQRRAVRIILGPNYSNYADACSQLGLASLHVRREELTLNRSLYGKASGDGASDSNDSGSKSDYDYTIKGLRVTSLYKLLADRGINPEPTADEHTVRPFRPGVPLEGCHERPTRIP